MDSPYLRLRWSFPSSLACSCPLVESHPKSRYMAFQDFVILWLNLPITPPRWPANWFNSSFETKVRVNVFERPWASRPMDRLPVRVASIRHGVWLTLWTMASSPPVIMEFWDSSVILVIVICLVADTLENLFVLNGRGFERISGDAYRIDFGLSQISGISASLSDVEYGVQ